MAEPGPSSELERLELRPERLDSPLELPSHFVASRIADSSFNSTSSLSTVDALNISPRA